MNIVKKVLVLVSVCASASGHAAIISGTESKGVGYAPGYCCWGAGLPTVYPFGNYYTSLFDYEYLRYDDVGLSLRTDVVMGINGWHGRESNYDDSAGEMWWGNEIDMGNTLTYGFGDTDATSAHRRGTWLGWVSEGSVIDGTTTGGNGKAGWYFRNGAWVMESNFAVDGTKLMAAFNLASVINGVNKNYKGWVEFSVLDNNVEALTGRPQVGASGNSIGDFQPYLVNVSRWAYENTGASIIAGNTGGVSAVPEPVSSVLMLGGLAAFWGRRRGRISGRREVA